jgi:hypothetical protein
VPSRCPGCDALLDPGVLRCRFCGRDVREAPAAAAVGTTLSTPAAVPSDVWDAAGAMDELGELAPEVLAWWRAADLPRKRRLVQLFGVLHACAERLLGPRR